MTTLTIHLGELLMRPVGPQFVELVNQGISATPRAYAAGDELRGFRPHIELVADLSTAESFDVGDLQLLM